MCLAEATAACSKSLFYPNCETDKSRGSPAAIGAAVLLPVVKGIPAQCSSWATEFTIAWLSAGLLTTGASGQACNASVAS